MLWTPLESAGTGNTRESPSPWRANWANLSTYFKYPQEVRRLIYTTNAIEGFNRQLRKVTKAKSVFPTDDGLLKMLYLAMMDITKKWTGRRQDWSVIHAQLSSILPDACPNNTAGAGGQGSARRCARRSDERRPCRRP